MNTSFTTPGGTFYKKNEPYRRVRAEEVDVDYKFDNSFKAKQGAQGSWGERAYRDLKETRGKGYRQEKNKKKKGSYRGGALDFGVNSVKFDSD
nr:nucleolar and coiled-body phosphoprotein 1-like isoform X2 [Cherax quadricarinatus]